MKCRASEEVFANVCRLRSSVFQPEFREWLPGVPPKQAEIRRNRPKLPGTKFANTFLCGCSNINAWINAWDSASNANMCGKFRCSQKVEKLQSNRTRVTSGVNNVYFQHRHPVQCARTAAATSRMLMVAKDEL